MKKGKVWNFGGAYLVLLCCFVVSTVAAAFFDLRLFYFQLGLLLVGGVVSLAQMLHMQATIRKIMQAAVNGLNASGSQMLIKLKMPVLAVSSEDEVLWYNRCFEKLLPEQAKSIGQPLSKLIPAGELKRLHDSGQSEAVIGGRCFALFEGVSQTGGVLQRIIYLVDQTSLRKTANEYALSRPSVAILAVDNLDDLTKDARESERSAISGAIQNEIENWFGFSGGISRRLSSDRFMLIMEERDLRALMEGRFRILDLVREMDFGALGNATLSIGVGRGGSSFGECEEMARQALDMAFGRGGDQAAVKTPDNQIKFFGGVTNPQNKRTKVRARIVAKTLADLIRASDGVILMGHQYSDLDSLGTCVGLYSLAKSLGKPAQIIIDRETTLSKPLLTHMEQADVSFDISDGRHLQGRISPDTLLIITDTHRPGMVENTQVYEECKRVAVIDHHRKAVDYIDNALLFYHETAASSCCEMVAELLQYINERAVGRIEAEALYAGIMLDTRNFVLNVSARTFEALAFLRNRGADTVSVKRLFSGTMPLYQQRANIVATAKLYGDCAIAQNHTQDENTRISTSQAADELLSISGVSGSFVLYRAGDHINISARSLGGMNVQLIMERLGGGGHGTMAACQVNTTSFDQAVKTLMRAIDEYRQSRNA